MKKSRQIIAKKLIAEVVLIAKRSKRAKKIKKVVLMIS